MVEPAERTSTVDFQVWLVAHLNVASEDSFNLIIVFLSNHVFTIIIYLKSGACPCLIIFCNLLFFFLKLLPVRLDPAGGRLLCKY